jgi:hypothetical protein
MVEFKNFQMRNATIRNCFKKCQRKTINVLYHGQRHVKRGQAGLLAGVCEPCCELLVAGFVRAKAPSGKHKSIE